MKRPAFQFYPADWRKDPELQTCSLIARGLWVEMLCVMHEADPYGHLRVSGRDLSAAQLARLVGESPAIVTRLVTELEDAGVFSRTAEGTIYSRRMVKDERFRNARAAGGYKSKGHPNVPRKKGDKDPSEDTSKDTLPPSFGGSPSSSSSSSEKKPPPLAGMVQEVFEHWRTRSGHEGATLTAERRKKISTRLKTYSVEQLNRAVDGACANPFFLGDNESGQRHDWPETIFRTDSTVEKHMTYRPPAVNGNGAGPHDKVVVWDEATMGKFR